MGFSKTDVIDTVTKLLQESNFDALSMDTIISATQVKRQSLYSQFGSKSGLVQEVLSRVIERADPKESSEILPSIIMSSAIKEPTICKLAYQIQEKLGGAEKTKVLLGSVLESRLTYYYLTIEKD